MNKKQTIEHVLYSLLCDQSGDKQLDDRVSSSSHMKYLLDNYLYKDKPLIDDKCIIDKDRGKFSANFDNLFDIMKYIEENYESEKEPARTGKSCELTKSQKKIFKQQIEEQNNKENDRIKEDRIMWEKDLIEYETKRKDLIKKIESFFEYKPPFIMRILKCIQPFKELNERSKERFIEERLTMVDKEMKDKYDSINRVNYYVDNLKKQERGES